jgi:hypothetical protein
MIEFKKNPLQVFRLNVIDIVIDEQDSYRIGRNPPPLFDLPVGTHTFKISFLYFGKSVGLANVKLDIAQDKKYLLTYKPPGTVFSGGKVIIRKYDKVEEPGESEEPEEPERAPE